MLAGTVLSDKNLQELQQMLAEHCISAQVQQDEIVISGSSSRLYFRTGFEHEYILVGDAGDGETLITEAKKISNLLRQHHIEHGFEIYDTDNQQIANFQFDG